MTCSWLRHFDAHGLIPSFVQDYDARQQSYLSFAKESRVGHSAIRSADVEAWVLENVTILRGVSELNDFKDVQHL